MSLTYKEAGVDIKAGDALVDWLKGQKVNDPHKDKVISGIGGFSALFKADFSSMKEPCLVSSTDGVGTKLKWAIDKKMYKEIGQDLVAMCVNDMLCCGAQPLFFLDYYASGRLNLDHAKDFLSGLQSACVESGCSLIGGETAEMPGLYSGDDFDCAGFSVGVVDKVKALGKHNVSLGNKIYGLESSGPHSNGYSLLRKLFEPSEDEWVKQLMAPTKLYFKAFEAIRKKINVNAAAHITGGGFSNITRVLPEGMLADFKSLELSSLFLEIQKRSQLTKMQMLETFNCGYGFMIITDEISATDQEAFGLTDLGEIRPSGNKTPSYQMEGCL